VLERHAVTTTPADADLAGITAAMKALQEADARGDQFDVATAHRDFHVAVVALAGNRQLTLVYQSVLLKIQLYMALNLRREAEVARPHDGVHRHERLHDAVTAHDPDAVLAALAEHGARSYLAG
jgi:DNA-binding GntR family transcriptional regulator